MAHGLTLVKREIPRVVSIKIVRMGIDPPGPVFKYGKGQVAQCSGCSPRFMVREEFPNGVVSELLRIDE
jgi:hypothetical protein